METLNYKSFKKEFKKRDREATLDEEKKREEQEKKKDFDWWGYYCSKRKLSE